MNYQEALHGLLDGPLHRFSDWPVPHVPDASAGVYSIWRGEELVYVGMAGRAWAADEAGRRADAAKGRHGLASRLHSHASGRRSGDQFCVYVCDRFVIPDLTAEDLEGLRCGLLSLDSRTRDYIRGKLGFRHILTPDGQAALRIERQVRQEGLGGQRPLLNPYGAAGASKGADRD